MDGKLTHNCLARPRGRGDQHRVTALQRFAGVDLKLIEREGVPLPELLDKTGRRWQPSSALMLFAACHSAYRLGRAASFRQATLRIVDGVWPVNGCQSVDPVWMHVNGARLVVIQTES